MALILLGESYMTLCVNNLPKVAEAERPGVDPRPFESRVQRPNHQATTTQAYSRPKARKTRTDTDGQR